ncbi:uncharacterized protein LOC131425611 [Malaya genurostris]|uniref:uncharacterized protein LOC131425611 n=1 Tax=Malaya genurostris TaxID=325434 RepID=UPI0026F40446|nr:uncharacterized protein LOC131425611 [Malaya genurostris]
MESMASLRLQQHKLTSIQISAETTVYTSLDSSLAALQRPKSSTAGEEDSGNSNSLPPEVELLLSAAAVAAAATSAVSTTDGEREKVVQPEELKKEERAEPIRYESSSAPSPELQKQQWQEAYNYDDDDDDDVDEYDAVDEGRVVVVDSSRSSAGEVEASAVGLAAAAASSALETVQEPSSLPSSVITDQESHVVRIQIVRKEDNNNKHSIDCSSVNYSTNSGSAVISVNNDGQATVLNNKQCKSKVSIVSFGPPDQEVSISPTPAEMVQKQASPSGTPTAKVGDLDVNNATYLYYMMSSGQCSPSDTLDSGTCSDIEVTPPPLPKKMSKSPQPPKQQLQQQQHATTTLMMIGSRSPTPADKPNQGGYLHQRVVGSSNYTTSDSDESESSLSCDSLNFAQLCGNISALELSAVMPGVESRSPVSSDNQSDSERDNGDLGSTLKKQKIVSFLPDSLLKDIRERSGGRADACENISPPAPCSLSPSPRDDIVTTTRSILMEKINSLNSVRPGSGDRDGASVCSSSVTATVGTNGIGSNKSLSFENDKFYKFHINEHSNLPERTSNGRPATSGSSSVIDDDESFAGFKDLTSGTSTIRSNKGTVRGVKNRVRNGIATFLQMQQANIKNYKEKDAGKVVVYTTSMGIVRETYTKCANVKQILRTLLVKFEERDVFMSSDYQQEIKDRMQSEAINVPQVFVDGQHVGDADCIERLNENGELRKMLKPYKCLESSFTCKTCGGYRLLPCPSCGGSKKSMHRNHFTAEFIALKCMNCDEVGLVKCHSC